MWDKCTITLNNCDREFYYSGDTVSGFVSFNLKSNKPLKNVFLKIYGETQVKWKENSSNSHPKRCYKKQVHIRSKTNLEESEGGNPDVFNDSWSSYFSLLLPEDIPSTFKSKTGHVIYFIKVTSGENIFNKKSTTLPFTVIRTLDLNADRINCLPSKWSKVKNFFPKGSITFHIETYKYFAPGQHVSIKININNRSEVSVVKLKAKLVQTVTYKVHNGTKHDVNCIASTKLENFLDSWETAEVTELVMVIPNTQTSTNGLETCLDISYKMVLKFGFNGLHIDMFEEYFVVIGTVPVEFEISHDKENSVQDMEA